MPGIRFYHDFTFEYGVLETISPLVRRIVARNPGPFTGPGTSTYIIGHGRVALIDPGPALADHIQAILQALRGETAESILITHTHPDHWPATPEIKRATGARTYAFVGQALSLSQQAQEPPPPGQQRPHHSFIPDEALRDGDVLTGAGWRITAVHTPGHASDHLCFSLAAERVLFSGDHVMGWSTSVISPPDGNLAAYMGSLRKLLDRDDAIYLPAHGPAIPHPKPHVQAFLEHREERTAAILERLAVGDTTIAEIVAAVYVDTPAVLRGAAARSVLAHLIELVHSGRVECDGPPKIDGHYRLTTDGRSEPRNL